MSHLASTPIALTFFVADVDGVSALTGLGDGDFTKTLHVNGVVSNAAASVSEIGAGFYALGFTPPTPGDWYATVRAPFDVIHGFRVDVGAIDIAAAVHLVRKTATNRLEVDFNTQELVLYDDNGTTPLQRWDLEAESGAVVPHEGVQSRRKAAKL